MTLYRQLLAAVIVLFLLLYSVNTLVNIHNNALLVERQMQIHAQDTATSLALSMTQAAMAEDTATLDTMFNAVSDRGYFHRVEFLDMEGAVLLQREFPVAIERVPDWFVNLIDLSAPPAEAEVSAGWVMLGTVRVHSYPGQAYRTLWSLTVQQLLWFVGVTVVVLLLSALALRLLLRPLVRVEEQAQAICEQQFPIQERLPRTRELARVVAAINGMSRRLKELFENQLALIGRLQEQCYRDPVTGLSNREDFDARLQAWVDTEEGQGSGAVIILSIADFARVNRLASRSEGNTILLEAGRRLQSLQDDHPQAVVARRQGPDFTLFVPHITAEQSLVLANQVLALGSSLHWSYQDVDPLVVHVGYTHHENFDDFGMLLREADVALGHARLQGLGVSVGFTPAKPTAKARKPRHSDDWRTLLERCISAEEVFLEFQPLVDRGRQSIGQEVYVRLKIDGELIPPGMFLPAAERFALIPAIDRLMLKALAARHGNGGPAMLMVNLSGSSAADSGFLAWLREFLEEHRSLAAKLVFEVAEYNLKSHGDAVVQLQQTVSAGGAALGLDHFGRSNLALQHLHSLPLRYLKVHRSFVRGVTESRDQQLYLHALVQMARTREIQIYAEGVESANEFESLATLGITAMQGYHLGRPQADPVT